MGTRPNALTRLARANLGAAWQRSILTWSDVLGLSGPLPDRILHSPPEYLSVERSVAEELRRGVYALPGGRVELRTGAAPWRITPPNTVWSESLHGFSWIRHFAALEDADTGEHLRWLISGWLSEKGRWDHIAWRPHVTARRLISCFTHGRLFLDGSDLIWRSSFLRSLARQSQHLYRTARWAPEGVPQLVSAIGLAVSGACLPGGERRLERGLALTEEQLERQILPDGGHVTQNPEVLLSLTIDLLVMRSALTFVDGPQTEVIQQTLDRMMPMLRFFRHGDGRLALFNGSDEGPDALVDSVLSEDETRGQPLRHARHSGFQRLARGRTLIIMETGAPPERTHSTEAHAGCLSFEMSVGRHRLIVNCGATKTHGIEWREALRATAAHSTAVIADTSSCTFVTGNAASAVQGAPMLRGPRNVVSEREEDDQGSWVTASHDGYAKDFGVTHKRKLYVSARGDDVRGEDTLECTKALRSKDKATPYAVRFHLHPDVRASLAQDETSVLLVLPNGDGWQFRSESGKIELEESTYLGLSDKIRRSEQIVITGAIEAETTLVTWVLKRLVKETGGRSGS